MSGGAMFGNCAVGRLSNTNTPTSTMTIEITMETIGRLMKNLLMGLLPRHAGSLLPVVVLRSRRGLVRQSLTRRRLIRFRRHRHAFLYLLDAFGDHPIPCPESLQHHPQRADLLASFDLAKAHPVLIV